MRRARAMAASIAGVLVLSAGPPLGAQDNEKEKDGIPVPAEVPVDPVEVTHVIFAENPARELSSRGGWLPVYVQVRCRGDRPETVTVEASVDPGRQDGPPFVTQKRFEVPPGAPTKAWVYLRAQPRAQTQVATIEFRCRGQIVRSGDRWTISSSEHQLDVVPAVFIVGGEETDYKPWLRNLPVEQGGMEVSSEGIFWYEPHQIPDRAIGYQAVDLVVLRGAVEKKLEASQKRALRDYVFLGGFVVLVPETRDAEAFAGELARELLAGVIGEAEIDQGFRPRNLYFRDLFSWRQARDRDWQDVELRLTSFAKEEDLALEDDVSYTRVDPFADTEDLLREIRSHHEEEIKGLARLKAEAPLVYGEARFGAGRVGVLTVNDQLFENRRSHGFRTHLWSRIILPAVNEPRNTPWRKDAADFVQSSLVNTCLKDSKRDIGTFLIGSMVIGYLVLVGPGIYFYLRRKDRLPAIIWVEPLVIVISLGAIFFTGYFTKGLLTKARLVTLLHRYDGTPLALRESYLSLFSADESDYVIESPRGDLLIPIFANRKESQEVRFFRRASGGGDAGRLAIGGIHLNQWQRGYALNAGIEELGAGVTLRELEDEPVADGGEFSDPPQGPRVEVTNHLPYTILRGEVRHPALRDSRRLPGPIESGRSVVVDFGAPDPDPLNEHEEREDGEEEDPKTVLEDFGQRGLRLRSQGRDFRAERVFWGLLDRDDDDFLLDRPFTVADRKDYFVLYR